MKKVALVTGGSRGIGLGIAQSLAKENWSLAINGMRPESAVVETLEQLQSLGTEVIYCQGNIGDRSDRENIIQKIVTSFGHLNVLVNNAGVAPKERKDLLEMSEESFDRVLNINLKGAFFLSQLAAKEMLKSKKADSGFEAAIVNVSSISATMVSINRGQYCISQGWHGHGYPIVGDSVGS